MKKNKKQYIASAMTVIKLQENFCLLQQSGDIPVGSRQMQVDDTSQYD